MLNCFQIFFTDRPAESLLWVDKYKPKLMSKIIGQQGEKSNAKKLYKWLVNWNDNNLGGEKPKGKGGKNIYLFVLVHFAFVFCYIN